MFYEITGGTKHERKLVESALLFAKALSYASYS